jgi:hypothetical protein
LTVSWPGLTRTGENENIYRANVRKLEGERKLGRPRFILVDNIKIDIKEIGLYVVEYVYLVQDR